MSHRRSAKQASRKRVAVLAAAHVGGIGVVAHFAPVAEGLVAIYLEKGLAVLGHVFI